MSNDFFSVLNLIKLFVSPDPDKSVTVSHIFVNSVYDNFFIVHYKGEGVDPTPFILQAAISIT